MNNLNAARKALVTAKTVSTRTKKKKPTRPTGSMQFKSGLHITHISFPIGTNIDVYDTNGDRYIVTGETILRSLRKNVFTVKHKRTHNLLTLPQISLPPP